jgi:DNA polymerase III psi subunit
MYLERMLRALRLSLHQAKTLAESSTIDAVQITSRIDAWCNGDVPANDNIGSLLVQEC